MDKKTLWWLIGGIGGIILLILILVLLNKLSNRTYNTYAQVETKLVEAAKKYYAVNPNYLPTENNQRNEVHVNTLVEGNYIKPLNKILRNGDSCDAKVVVIKNKLDYEYTPYLNCGDKYISIELYKKVLEDNTIVNKGAGLYNIENEKVFRGEVKNNYILLNENKWRILRIDDNNNLVLLSEFRTDSTEWDNRYNVEVDSEDGISNYNLSRIKEYIEKEYYDGVLLKDVEKSKVVYQKACLASREKTASGSMRNIECRELSEEELPVRLLTVGEYLISSIDPNCKTIEDRGCTNYNFIHDLPQSFWTITKGQRNSAYIYAISTSGVYETRANNSKQLRYVVSLGMNTMYSSGSGTYDDPYVIK